MLPVCSKKSSGSETVKCGGGLGATLLDIFISRRFHTEKKAQILRKKLSTLQILCKICAFFSV